MAKEKSTNDDEIEKVTFVDEQTQTTAKTLADSEAAKIPRDSILEGLDKKIETPAGATEGMKKALDKIRIKINKFGTLVAESEQFIYHRWKLNRLMTEQEVEDEKKEVVDDVNIMIDNRIKVFSTYGDILNLVIDFMSHIATRAFRFYGNKEARQKVLSNEGTGTTTSGEPDYSLSQDDMQHYGIGKK
jgi:hypothetical protein